MHKTKKLQWRWKEGEAGVMVSEKGRVYLHLREKVKGKKERERERESKTGQHQSPKVLVVRWSNGYGIVSILSFPFVPFLLNFLGVIWECWEYYLRLKWITVLFLVAVRGEQFLRCLDYWEAREKDRRLMDR